LALAAEDPPEIVLLHTSDIHGYYTGSDTTIGHDTIAVIFEQTKAQTPATFLLSSGDMIQGNFFVNSSRGAAAIDIMNAAGDDAMCLGNHEFDYGLETLSALAKKAQFPILSQAPVDFARRTALITRGDYPLGGFALPTPETAHSSAGAFGMDFGTTDTLIAAAQETVGQLKEAGADVVVCLAHLGSETVLDPDGQPICTSLDIRDNVEGIDVILDGHSHTPQSEIVQAEGKALISSVSEYGEELGIVEFQEESGVFIPEVSVMTPQDAAGMTPDAAVTAVIDRWTQAADIQGQSVVGYSPVAVPAVREELRTRETAMGDIIADAMREAAGTDVALMNGGGIRASLDAGDITRAEVNSVLPFENYLFTAEVSGQAIWDALEISVASYPAESGGFLQVSGLIFTFDPGRPAGDRVVSGLIGGERLQPEQTYTVATNDYLAVGGNGYTMFTAPFEQGKAVGNGYMADVLTRYLSAHGEYFVLPQIGRIITTADELKPYQAVIVTTVCIAGLLTGFVLLAGKRNVR
jgi:2',3'-cyclic-nucleotide 2'-phosphodiesterase (5'-nucleotidase family)